MVQGFAIGYGFMYAIDKVITSLCYLPIQAHWSRISPIYCVSHIAVRGAGLAPRELKAEISCRYGRQQ
jgi:hypothetical protein